MDEAIERFCIVTGSDSIVAAQYLQMSEGNIERAIEVYFDTGSNNHSILNEQETLRDPIPQKHERLVEPEPNFSRYNVRTRPNDRSMAYNNRTNQSPTTSIRNGSSPIEKLFEPPHHLVFIGSFAEVKKHALSQNKWLLVSIHNEHEFDCHVLNRDFWTNVGIQNIVQKSFILWQVKLEDSLSQDFTKWYEYDKTKPHLAVLDPKTGECKVSFQEKTMCPYHFHDILSSFVHQNSSEPSHKSPSEIPSTSSFNNSPNSTNGCHNKNKRKIITENNEFIDLSTDEPVQNKKQRMEISPDNSNDKSSTSREIKVASRRQIKESVEDYLGNENDPLFTIILRLPNGERDTIVMPCSTKLKAVFLYLDNKGYQMNDYEIVMMGHPQKLTTKMCYMTLTDCQIANRSLLIVQEIY